MSDSSMQKDQTKHQPMQRSPAVTMFLCVLLPFFLIVTSLGIGYYYWDPFSLHGPSLTESFHSGTSGASDKIVIISLRAGIIESVARQINSQLDHARTDKNVKAIVLRVDSPGGTVNASDHIHRRVKEVCQGENAKPIVVSMQGIAASGGYYISAPTNKIFAEPTTITGSIGVIATFPDASGLMDRFDVKMNTIATGAAKDSGSPFRPMTEKERERWHEIIDHSFLRFKTIVSEGRGLDMAEVEGFATGEVFTSTEALDLKLVDEIGYLEDAIEAAAELAGMTEYSAVEYAYPPSLYSTLLGLQSDNKPLGLNSLLQGEPRMLMLARRPEFMFSPQ